MKRTLVIVLITSCAIIMPVSLTLNAIYVLPMLSAAARDTEMYYSTAQAPGYASEVHAAYSADQEALPSVTPYAKAE